jgi:hypothetical protein
MYFSALVKLRGYMFQHEEPVKRISINNDMKKTTRHFDTTEELDRTKEYAALIEPLPGHSDAEVATRLQELGASEVGILSPGFISAQATGDTLGKLTHVAHIHLKHENHPKNNISG